MKRPLRHISVVLAALLAGSCASNQYVPEAQLQTVDDREMLLGSVRFSDILHYFSDWKNVYEKSTPSPATTQLKAVDYPVRIECYLGTWCHDSRDGVPPFIKDLENTGNTNIELELIAVDRQKVDPDFRAPQAGISRVPTFIIYRDNIEIGRLIEFPEGESFTEDAAAVLTGF